MGIVLGHPARQIPLELSRCDPSTEYERVVRLFFLHEHPFITRLALRLIIFRGYGVPSIARTAPAGGGFYKNAMKRYDDTEILLAFPHERGFDDAETKAALQKINKVHARLGSLISNDDLVYLLACFMVGPVEYVSKYGYRQCTENEADALFEFYRRLSIEMNITDIPATRQDAAVLVREVEATRFECTREGKDIARKLIDTLLESELGGSWLARKCLYPVCRPLAIAALPAHVKTVFDFPQTRYLQWIIDKVLKLRAAVIAFAGTDRTEPVLYSEMKRLGYPNGYSFDDLGR